MSDKDAALSAIAKPANLHCKDLQEFLKSLTPEALEKLYEYPAICIAVYRELPEIANEYVTRILFVEQAVPQAVVASWVAQDCLSEHDESIKCLSDLNVWRVTAIPGGLSAWELCPTFKRSLKTALVGGGKPWSTSYTLEKDSKPRDVVFLDSYAMSRWRCVLHYMVGLNVNNKTQETEGISPDAVRILIYSNLMKRDENDGLIITRQGFQFLLLDTRTQVWYFMLQYLETCPERGFSQAECLSMLLQLSFCTLGRDYSSEGMSPQLLTFLQHLREFGLVFQRKRKEGRFYPTRLALNISNKNNSSMQSWLNDKGKEQNTGYLVIETNFRVYGYTTSPLQVAILALFTQLLYRFPNMVVGVLTRDSVRQALRGGITADQIINYLHMHTHPKMHKADAAVHINSKLPPTVVDQIMLWEAERNRLNFTEGVVYNQFLSQADFVTLRDYAQSLGVLLWQNERLRSMIVEKDGHDEVKKYWKRYSKGGG